jgi:hypothetical protein
VLRCAALLFTFLLKALAGPIIYTLMVGVLISSMGATTILGFKAGYLDPNSLPASVGGYANTKMPAGMTLGPAQTNQEFVIAATVFMGVFTLIYMVLFCVMLPRKCICSCLLARVRAFVDACMSLAAT